MNLHMWRNWLPLYDVTIVPPELTLAEAFKEACAVFDRFPHIVRRHYQWVIRMNKNV